MLIEFRVANYRSFRDEQTLSLVADGAKDSSHPGNLIPQGKFDLLKAAAIYGSNASGKSNLFHALTNMVVFVRNSAKKMTLGDPIPWSVPFRLDVEFRHQPTSFEVTVLIDGTRYVYGFSATSERVHDEWLNVTPPAPKKEQRWLERIYDPETNLTKWIFRGPLAKERKLLGERTRENGLVLSRGAELNVAALQELFLWFSKSVFGLNLAGPVDVLLDLSLSWAAENEARQQRVLDLIKHADLGIEGIVLRQIESRTQDIASDNGRPSFEIRTMHCVGGADEMELFDMSTDESQGTQRMFALAGPILDALDTGALVVVDELECSMHPLLTRKLLELFQSPQANTQGAQLVFATHDTTLMDPTLFRRDQIWLVEKDRDGASQLFSLYDFNNGKRPRNTEAFQRNYLAGRYGGVPNFGATFEDLELR